MIIAHACRDASCSASFFDDPNPVPITDLFTESVVEKTDIFLLKSYSSSYENTTADRVFCAHSKRRLL
jgi:hypothetical protein